MKITCKKNTSKDFDLSEVTTSFSQDETFPLVQGKVYIVMGLSMLQDSNCLYYLIDENNLPAWYPYVLFEISNNLLPAPWFIHLNNKTALKLEYFFIGFEELCIDSTFAEKLSNGDELAVAVYFERKSEVSKYLEMFE